MNNSNNQRLSVQAGYCGDTSSKTNPCVLKQSDCNADDAWSSSRQMEGAPYSGHGGYCLWASTVKNDVVGNQEFGACQNNASGGRRCSYAADHCVEGEESWIFPVADCSCDEVRVGGCEKDGRIFCAATEDGCDDGTTWMDPLAVSSQAATDCYLCIAKTTVAPIEAPVAAPTSAPVMMVSPTSAPVVTTAQASNRSGLASTDEGSDNLMAAAIGGAVGGVLLLTLATAFFVTFSRKRKAKADAAAAAPPTKNLEAVVAQDTVSNLDEEEFQAREKSDFV